MPSLPPQDGVDARSCAGIRAGALTVSPADSLTTVDSTSLPLPPMGEHDAIGSPSGTFPRTATQSLVWVDGTLTMFVRGENAFSERTGLLPASLLGCPSRR